MKILIALLLMSSVATATVTDGKFCYDRKQAEEIAQCLKMQDFYRNMIPDKYTPAPCDEITFWQSDVGRGLLFVLGVGFGLTVHTLSK